MESTDNSLEMTASNADVPDLLAGDPAGEPPSVVELPAGMVKKFHRGRLVFQVPPMELGPVCYTNCPFQCFNCVSPCLCSDPTCTMTA